MDLISQRLDENPLSWLPLEIKLCRTTLGLSQIQLSELSGISSQAIKRMELSSANPRYDTLMKVRNVFFTLGVSCEKRSDGFYILMSADLQKAVSEQQLQEWVESKIVDN